MKTIAVIFGGKSAEHDISILTAIASIIKPLRATGKYRVEPIYIAKDGKWYNDEELSDVSFYQRDVTTGLRSLSPIQLELGGGLTIVKSSKFAGRKAYKKIDLVFPSMHGTNGEDGALMGLLNMADVPYVGCGLEASAISMDKVTSKLLVDSKNIPTPKMVYFTDTDYSRDMTRYHTRISQDLTMPLFVKPANLGSSIGISRVANETELTNAIEVALHYDTKVLVEEAVQNLIEVTVPIMGNDELTPASVEQPVALEDGVFDFDSKYMKQGKGKMGGAKAGGAKQGAQGYSKIPAEISSELYEKSLQTATASFKALGCEGYARIDLLIDEKSETVYFNEVNPLPGSLYAHNWRASGVSNVELVERLITLAEERYSKQQSKKTVFETNFLKQF